MTARKKATRKNALPASLPFFGGSYRVVEVAKLMDMKENYGECDFRNRTIRIDSSMAYDTKLVTLEHEKVHAIIDDAEIKLPRKLEEQVCEAIARHRVFEMQQAPSSTGSNV